MNPLKRAGGKNGLEDSTGEDNNTAIPEINENEHDQCNGDADDTANANAGDQDLTNGLDGVNGNNISGKLSDAQDENDRLKVEDMAALGPVGERIESPNLARKKHNLVIDEAKATAGFQDLKNAGRFWKASQIMGTRKGRSK